MCKLARLRQGMDTWPRYSFLPLANSGTLLYCRLLLPLHVGAYTTLYHIGMAVGAPTNTNSYKLVYDLVGVGRSLPSGMYTVYRASTWSVVYGKSIA